MESKIDSNITTQNLEEASLTLRYTLTLRNSEFQKSGPGARAKSNAFTYVKSKHQGTGSTFLPGATALTLHHYFNLYKYKTTNPNLKTKGLTVIETQKGGNNLNNNGPGKFSGRSGTSPKQSPTGRSSGRKKISTSTLIESRHQEKKIEITDKDISKWITPAERQRSLDQKANEKFVIHQYASTIKNPDEVLNGQLVYHKQRDCKVYVKEMENTNGTTEKFVVIVNSKTGRAYLGSTVSQEEYEHIKETGEISLFDLRRDPQTLAKNEKSLIEHEILERAKSDGYLTDCDNIRRPVNRTESNHDFVAKDKTTGKLIEIDVKSFDSSGKRPIHRQANNIHDHIVDLYEKGSNPSSLKIVCDLTPVPNFLQELARKNVTRDLDLEILENSNFLYD